ncbi:MAG: T9SS C-terminal target domain-containing protein [Sphingobacteriia bacterium]|nr:MAG: T9SS C-terminal target domain-containing protein [Sphingobacteriia bacterium]
MGNSGGIWTNNSGVSHGRHATCIVGFDDVRQQLKIQNSWGASWGDNGYYWVPYSFVLNNCFEEVYILYGSTPSVPFKISGPDILCSPSIGNYTIDNLPVNSTVNWTIEGANILATTASVSPSVGIPITVNIPNGLNQANLKLTAVIAGGCAGPTPIVVTKNIQVGLALSDISVRFSRNGGASQSIDFGTSNSKTIFTQIGSFSVTAFTLLSGTNTFDWTVAGSSSGSGYGWSNFTKSGPNCSFRLSGTNAPTIPLQVTLTNTQNGCSNSNSKYVVFVASIPGGNLRSVVASPNPAGSKLNISLLTSADSSFTQKVSSEITPTPSYKSYASKGKTVISLFEISSHTLVRQWISNEVNSKSYQHDLSGIRKGLYVLQIDRDNETITTKIIKE